MQNILSSQSHRISVASGAIIGGAPSPTHKTKGMIKTEIRAMLTEAERIRMDRAMANIEGDLSWLAVDPDENAAAIGKPDFTYRDLLRTSFADYKDATTFDVDHPDYLKGWQLNAYVGLLDSPDRVAVLMQGFPLNAGI